MSNPLEAFGEAPSAPAGTRPSAGEISDAPVDFSNFGVGWVDFSGLAEIIEMGGPITLILLAMSVITLTVILAKLWQFARAGVGRTAGTDEALALWSRGRADPAIKRLDSGHTPAARVAVHAMNAVHAGVEEAKVREDTERLALGELASLRSHLRVIEATVQTAPLLGLFGTVLGMIASFQALEGAGAQADPAVLAGGIWVALLTTAVGLAIAIPAALALTWFQGRIERERERIEDAATSVFTRGLTSTSDENRDSPAMAFHREDTGVAARREAL